MDINCRKREKEWDWGWGGEGQCQINEVLSITETLQVAGSFIEVETQWHHKIAKRQYFGPTSRD